MKKIVLIELMIIIGLCLMTAPVSACKLDVTASCNDVHLSVSDNYIADHYNVYRGTASGGPYQLIASISNKDYEDTAADCGTRYYYIVRPADNENVEYSQSNEVSAAVPTSVPEFPSIFLPVTMIIGFLGASQYIKRTREH
jgi:fibronectin type 3 domain-containing protein